MYDITQSQLKEAPDGTGYNDPPFNLKEITEAEFAKSQFHSYTPAHIEFRQMILMDNLAPGKLKNGKMVQAQLFWFPDDTGLAISSDYYKGKIRYFSFGCNHKVEQRVWRPGQRLMCSKCGTDVQQPWMEHIKEDSGWSMNTTTSIPGRGIRDYERTMKFDAKLSPTELLRVVKFLKKTDCPGWTGVGVRDKGDGQYLFTTTYDSSD